MNFVASFLQRTLRNSTPLWCIYNPIPWPQLFSYGTLKILPLPSSRNLLRLSAHTQVTHFAKTLINYSQTRLHYVEVAAEAPVQSRVLSTLMEPFTRFCKAN